MFPSKEARIQRWAVTRLRGKRRFIIINGILGWGLPTGFFWCLFMWAFTPDFRPALSVPVALILFPLGGIAWGALIWRASEKHFAEYRSSKS